MRRAAFSFVEGVVAGCAFVLGMFALGLWLL